MILLQAINSINGNSVSAEWTLNGMTVIVGALIGFVVVIVGWVFVTTLTTIKDEIKGLHKRVDTREEEHDELKDHHKDLASRVKVIESHPHLDAARLADEMISKMRAASGGRSFKID